MLLTGEVLPLFVGYQVAVRQGYKGETVLYGVLCDDMSVKGTERSWHFQLMDILEVRFPSLGVPIIIAHSNSIKKWQEGNPQYCKKGE